MEQLNKRYVELLTQADKATNRKEALRLIHEADRIRWEMTQQVEHPVCYG